VYGGLNLLRAAVEMDVKRLVFSSSCATYGIPERVPIDEATPQHPINPYGESKLMFEKILRWFDQIHGIKYVALRYFNAAGASQQFGEHHRIETHLIPRVLAVALGHTQQAEIFGTDYPTPDGSCIRDYIDVRDLAQAHILALSASDSGFFNLGTGGGASVCEVIEACRQVTGRTIPVVEKPRRPGDPPRLVAASAQAKKVLGWEPKYQDIREIVESAWAWHETHPNGYSI
jgi:UDP-glucose 4-epimerase